MVPFGVVVAVFAGCDVALGIGVEVDVVVDDDVDVDVAGGTVEAEAVPVPVPLTVDEFVLDVGGVVLFLRASSIRLSIDSLCTSAVSAMSQLYSSL